MEVRSSKVVNTEWGDKLEFTVPRDHSEIAKQLNRVDWDETHYDIPRDKRRPWKVDLSFKAFDLVEEKTDLELPRDRLIPEENDVILKIENNSLFINIEKCPDTVIEAIKEAVSYEVEWYDRKNHKKRTNKKDLVFNGNKIPIGLERHVIDALDDLEGVHHTLIDYRQEPDIGQIDSFEWNFPHELRDYQEYGLKRCLEGSCVVQWPTGAGKTVFALRLMYELGLPTLVVVHRQELLNQWCKEIRNVLGVEPGVIQGDREEHGKVTVAMIQSIHNRIEENDNYKINDYHCFITDECHHIPSDTWFNLALNVNAYYRYGLSATAESGLRNDEQGLKIIGGIGPNDIRLDPERLISQGYLAEPNFEWIYPTKVEGSFDDWQVAYNEGIVNHVDRNTQIIEKTLENLYNGRRVLIDVRRIDHGEQLLSMFPDGLHRDWWDPATTPRSELPYRITFDPSGMRNGKIAIVHNGRDVLGFSRTGNMLEALDQAVEEAKMPVGWVHGEDDEEIREYMLSLFENGDLTGMISTLLGEGVNIPAIDTIVLAGGGKSSIQLIQTIGRSLRVDREGKQAKIIDCADVGKYVRDHFEERMKTIEEYYGEYFQNYPVGYD